MWLSEQRGKKSAGEAPAEWGPVTVGQPPAVYLAGERRQVPLCCPGGYAWRPRVGEQVMVLKAGAEGEQPTILGVEQGWDNDLDPGQVRFGSEKCQVVCGERVEIKGEVVVNGEPLEEMILRMIAGLLSPEPPVGG